MFLFCFHSIMSSFIWSYIVPVDTVVKGSGARLCLEDVNLTEMIVCVCVCVCVCALIFLLSGEIKAFLWV